MKVENVAAGKGNVGISYTLDAHFAEVIFPTIRMRTEWRYRQTGPTVLSERNGELWQRHMCRSSGARYFARSVPSAYALG